MTPEELKKRQERARTEPLIVSRTEDGFRVYSAANRSRIYEVTGVPDDPVCSCPDFERHAMDPDWKCKHVLAVQNRLAMENGRHGNGPQTNGEGAKLPRPERPLNGSQMLIKRSVSPDGRIDALSVEFSLPVDMGNGEAESYAARILRLQNEIAGRFLKRDNGEPERPASQPARAPLPTDRAIPATITGMDAGDTRKGRRLFLRFQVGERTLRRYGSWQKLADLVSEAGYPEEAENLQERTRLDLPCRVRLQRSRDGRYLNVAQVLPARAGTSAGTRGSVA